MGRRESQARPSNKTGMSEEPNELIELLNMNFQIVFTNKSHLQGDRESSVRWEMWEIEANSGEIQEMVNDLEERKVIDPDEVSGHNLTVRKQQLIQSINDATMFTKKGKFPRGWKRDHIIPVKKRVMQTSVVELYNMQNL